ncbi:MAG: hypothetical protein LBQ27_05775 [Clostridiales bacterium]|jgi:hypothetical protein|nr:hypothetical protein [Clostridiales bacterium]
MKRTIMKHTKKLSAFKLSVCGIFLIVAIAATFLKVKDYDMISMTISDIGKTQPVWFLLWGMLTSITVLLNLFFICEKLNIKASLVYLMIINCSLSFMLPAIYVGESALSLGIHTLGVGLFGILGYSTIMYCILGYAKKNGDGRVMIFFCILIGILVASATAYAVFGFNGLVELILLVGAELFMLAFDVFFKPIIV